MSDRVVLGAGDRRFLRDAGAVIGVDEVGRGALAGPVVVCAARFETIPEDSGIRDSKELSPKQREAATTRLFELGPQWAVCEIWPELIDRINILEATRLAMRAAAAALATESSVVITDHVVLRGLGCRVVSPAKADRDFFCVAAASIIAKVHRDRIMVALGQRDPRWGWERNKGYGTLEHRSALEAWGPTRHHRRTFAWKPAQS